MAAFRGMHVSPAKIAMRDYQESVTTRQTHRQTDAGQSDPYVLLCFADDTKTEHCKFRKDYNSYINGRKTTTLELDMWFTIRKSYTKFQLNMSKHVGEKYEKLFIPSILSTKRGKKLTQNDHTQSRSQVHTKKDLYKMSSQYNKACRSKVRKTVFIKYSMFQKRQKLTESTDI